MSWAPEADLRLVRNQADTVQHAAWFSLVDHRLSRVRGQSCVRTIFAERPPPGSFGGPAFFTNALSRPFEIGLSADATVFHPRRNNLGAGFLAEGGFFHPAISGKGNYYFSADAMLDHVQPEHASAVMKVRLFAVAGYTRLFSATTAALDAASAVNFGIGVDRVLSEELGLRLEAREMYSPSSGSHAMVLRIGLVGIESVQ